MGSATAGETEGNQSCLTAVPAGSAGSGENNRLHSKARVMGFLPLTLGSVPENGPKPGRRNETQWAETLMASLMQN